ncbi:MAG: hypothetical protein K9J81_01750 [Desulfohalobiaceae bacterium]|nr:hypothetical protein [Desulfohalobiaceae bacterium]
MHEVQSALPFSGAVLAVVAVVAVVKNSFSYPQQRAETFLPAISRLGTGKPALDTYGRNKLQRCRNIQHQLPGFPNNENLNL